MVHSSVFFFFFFFNDTATTEIYTLSLHDALPISMAEEFPQRESELAARQKEVEKACVQARLARSEEHTSELQSPCNLVCRLLLEKKKKQRIAQLTLVTIQCVRAYDAAGYTEERQT